MGLILGMIDLAMAPDLSMLSADRYNVIQLDVDLAMDRVAPAVGAAPE